MKKFAIILYSLLSSIHLIGQHPRNLSEKYKEKIKVLEMLWNATLDVRQLKRASSKDEVVTVYVPDRLLERNKRSRRLILDAFLYVYVNYMYNNPDVSTDSIYAGICAKSDSLNPLEAAAAYPPSFTSFKDRLIILSESLIRLSPFYQDVFMQEDELVLRFKYSGTLNEVGMDYINNYSFKFGGIIGKYFINKLDVCNRILILWEGSNGEMFVSTLFPHDPSFKKAYKAF